MVNIRAFLTVNLNRDKVAIEYCGSFMVFKGFSFHDMAPVTSRHRLDYEYPIDKKIGLFSALAVSNASSPQGNQFTGLLACCNKYGDFSLANLLGTFVSSFMAITTFQLNVVF